MSISSRQGYALAAAMSFAAAAGYALWHLISFRPFGMLRVELSLALALFDATVWIAAAATLIARDRSPRLLRASFVLAVFGTLLGFIEGLVLRGALGLPSGIAFIFGSFVVAFLVKQAFTPFPFRREGGPSVPPTRYVRTSNGTERPAI